MNAHAKLLTALVLGSLLLTGSAHAYATTGSECEQGDEQVNTLKVDVGAVRASARRGTTVPVVVEVHRTHDGSTELTPAAGVDVVVALLSRGKLTAGHGTTNAEGVATIDVNVPRRFPLGWADASVSAERKLSELCGGTGEVGRALRYDFVKVTR